MCSPLVSREKMPWGTKKSSSKRKPVRKTTWKKKSTWKGKAKIYRRKTVAAKRKGAGVKRKATVKMAPTANVSSDLLGVNAGYGDAGRNGAVGTYSKARGVKPFSDRFFCKDRWIDMIADYTFPLINTPALNLSWGANCPWDPQPPVGPNQASAEWFGILGEIYLYYRVHACAISVTVDTGVSNMSAVNSNIFVGVYPYLLSGAAVNAPILPQNIEQLKLMPNVHTCQLVPSSDRACHTIKHYMMIKDLFGISNIADEMGFIGQFTNSRNSQGGTNPTNQCFWICQAFMTDNRSNVELNVRTELKFDLECFGLVQPDEFNGDPGKTKSVEDSFTEMNIEEEIPKVIYPGATLRRSGAFVGGRTLGSSITPPHRVSGSPGSRSSTPLAPAAKG